VASARLFVVRLGGAPITGLPDGITDAQGVGDLIVPAGSLEIRAGKERFQGTGSVRVAEGGEASIAIALTALAGK
jgi:hypothetical protein